MLPYKVVTRKGFNAVSLGNILIGGAVDMLVDLATGCVSTYTSIPAEDGVTAEKMERNKSVLIALPADGIYAEKKYAESGMMTALSVKSAFARYSDEINISNTCKQREQCYSDASTARYKYFVIPEILHWEDRATEWSGIPDKIEVKISIYETAANRKINSVVLQGKSKWMTFGGDHPQDLLDSPISAYIASLYD